MHGQVFVALENERMREMENNTNWNALWRELVEIKIRSHEKRRAGTEQEKDAWCKKALEFKEGVKRRWSKPDSSRDFILSQISSEATVLDIGAGVGAWSAILARKAKNVTAVEPSQSMINVMRDSLAEEGIANVTIVQGSWPDVRVEPHDYSLCSHSMYGYPDLAAFVRRMVETTIKTCFLLLRAPTLDGVRSEAARHIWGQPFDSPNFTIAYNILLQMGIYANVLMEDTGLWKPRKSASMEEALKDLKRYLALDDDTEHEPYLKELLKQKLKLRGGYYFWPPEVRSALVYWQAKQ
jgi:2-polyprenyl-3-methyl-5-hydroxy-6-metoxy-1,4-benzoquinol methylase